MLTKSELDLLPDLRLSHLKPPSEPDVTKQLDAIIAELAVNGDRNLDGNEVTLVILKTLAELLRRTKPQTVTISSVYETMDEQSFDARMAALMAVPEYDPVGAHMGFDSVYDD